MARPFGFTGALVCIIPHADLSPLGGQPWRIAAERAVSASSGPARNAHVITIPILRANGKHQETAMLRSSCKAEIWKYLSQLEWLNKNLC